MTDNPPFEGAAITKRMSPVERARLNAQRSDTLAKLTSEVKEGGYVGNLKSIAWMDTELAEFLGRMLLDRRLQRRRVAALEAEVRVANNEEL